MIGFVRGLNSEREGFPIVNEYIHCFLVIQRVEMKELKNHMRTIYYVGREYS